jgi:hypothetical protein
LTGVADFTFTRTGDQFGIDSGGNLVKSTTDVAAFIDGEGVLLEGARTNLFLNSFVPVTQTITVTAVAHTITVKGTGNVTVTGVGAGVATEGSPLTLTPTAGGLICTVNGTLTNVNVEAGSFGSSFIETFGATASRSATSLTRAWPFPANGISGQIKVRPQFDSTDTLPTEFRVFSFGNPPVVDDSLDLVFRTTDNRLQLQKRVTTGTDIFLTSAALSYSAGDLLNVRFKIDPVAGASMWVDGLAVVNNSGNDDFTNLLTDIFLNERIDGGSDGFSVIESLRIWNEAKSDVFLEALV